MIYNIVVPEQRLSPPRWCPGRRSGWAGRPRLEPSRQSQAVCSTSMGCSVKIVLIAIVSMSCRIHRHLPDTLAGHPHSRLGYGHIQDPRRAQHQQRRLVLQHHKSTNILIESCINTAILRGFSPPVFWISAMACKANVVLPDDSGPYISITLPLGKPPPRAMSRVIAPDEVVSTTIFSFSPRRSIAPLPYDLSIWWSTPARASFLTSSDVLLDGLLTTISASFFLAIQQRQ